MTSQKQGLALMTALCVLIGVLLIIQLWLVAAALDALLAGEKSVLVPAAVWSFILCAMNAGMLAYAIDFDRRLRNRTGRT